MVNGYTLGEQILLLHMDDRTGRWAGTYTSLLLVAAEVAELAWDGRVQVTEKSVLSLAKEPTDDPGRGAMLDRLQRAPRGLTLPGLCPAGEERRQLEQAVAGRLVGRGTWASEQRQVWFFHRMIYATIDPEPARQVRFGLQKTLESRQPAEEKQAVLLGLLKAEQRLDLILTRQERRFFRDRIAAIIAGSPLANALCRQIEKIIADDQAAAAVVIAIST